MDGYHLATSTSKCTRENGGENVVDRSQDEGANTSGTHVNIVTSLLFSNLQEGMKDAG